jgi:hypothetical protein
MTAQDTYEREFYCPTHNLRYRWIVSEHGSGSWKCPECENRWGEHTDGAEEVR